MDPSVQHSFRSQMLNDIGRAINNLIEGEATMKRAVGRLWQAVYSIRQEDGPSSGASGPGDDATRVQSQPPSLPNGDIFGGYKTYPVQENGDVRPTMMEDVDEGVMDGQTSRDVLPNDDVTSDEVPKPHKLPHFLSPGLMAAIK
jgi:hypothetical protein